MENVNTTSTSASASTSTTTATLRQQQQQQQHHQLNQQSQQQHQQHFQLQQHQQEQQQQHEHQQQFCLRWHNHQTSLLSTLPILLDQSHLTDVTISAEGRTLRAHRVVLSACSSFFLELFRALDTTNHPVIILPGASFTAIVALLTFMYSGEVNVYEEQIPILLNLAETLGVKGLADVQNNKSSANQQSMDCPSDQQSRKDDPIDTAGSLATQLAIPPPTSAAAAATEAISNPTSTPTPTPPPASVSAPPIVAAPFSAATLQQHSLPHSLATTIDHSAFSNPLLAAGKGLPTQLENFFLKSLQFYPNLLPQPLNFTQTALNKTTEFLAKYRQQCSLYQGALSNLTGNVNTLIPMTESVGREQREQQHHTTSSPLKTSLAADDGAGAIKRFCSTDNLKACNMFLQHQQQQQQQQQQQHQTIHQQKDIKKIDRIVESLRCGNLNNRQAGAGGGGGGAAAGGTGALSTTGATATAGENAAQMLLSPQQNAGKTSSSSASNDNCSFASTKGPPIFPMTAMSPPQQQHSSSTSALPFDLNSPDVGSDQPSTAVRHLQQQFEQFTSCSRMANEAACEGNPHLLPHHHHHHHNQKLKAPTSSSSLTASTTAASVSSMVEKFGVSHKAAASLLNVPTSPGGGGSGGGGGGVGGSGSGSGTAGAQGSKTPSNSKLYATCFICHKQLSNQYNLRVHLETHQNVRYACNVCSHVSRSKDALRKHVSYRHPGAPSPCETEARRKRASKLLLSNVSSSSSSNNNNLSATSPPSTSAIGEQHGSSGSNNNNLTSNNEAQLAAQLNSAAAYMFLPNQFHLAAAAAAVAQQQQQQHHQQQQQQQQTSPPQSPQSLQNFTSPMVNSSAASTGNVAGGSSSEEVAAAQSTTTIVKQEQQSPIGGKRNSSTQSQSKAIEANPNNNNEGEDSVKVEQSSSPA